MNRSEPTWCRWSDAVLARHLDGELADDGVDHPLDAHLQTCARCQQALRRARRLDAVLAQESGEFQHGRLRNGELEARWFAAVAVAARGDSAVAARSVPTRLLRHRRWLAVAAAAAVLGGLLLRPERTAAPSDPDGCRTAPIASARPVASSDQSTPTAPSTMSAMPVGIASSDPNGSEPRAVAIDLRELRHWGAGDRSGKPSARDVAARADVLATPHAIAARDLIARLQNRDTAVLEPSFLRQALAANHAEVDEALRRRMRRHPGGLALVAAAAREIPSRSSTARLLLDLWEDTAARGDGTDHGLLAHQLFAGQSSATFRELGQLAGARGHAVRQHRCWLALGWSHDLDPTSDLLAVVHGPSREASVAAAFAMSCQPWQRLLPLAHTASSSNGFLVRAALWRNGAPELAALLTEWPLPLELQQQLRACSFATFTELVDGLRHGAGALAE